MGLTKTLKEDYVSEGRIRNILRYCRRPKASCFQSNTGIYAQIIG